MTLTLVVVRTTDPHRQSEALRAALGLTLRGARVAVIVNGDLRTPLAERAAATLRSFGYPVDAAAAERVSEALARADAVEVWTSDDGRELGAPPGASGPYRAAASASDDPPARQTLHLVRGAAEPIGVADGDWVVDVDRRRLADRGTPPIAPGEITDDQLVRLIFAAARVVTW